MRPPRSGAIPHVNVNGQPAFDFSGTTTFGLDDGTKIAIDTEPWSQNPDAYVASRLTITEGDQAIVANGISQNVLGDLSIAMSDNGCTLDAATQSDLRAHAARPYLRPRQHYAEPGEWAA